MGLILRSSSLANSGNTVSVKGSALTYNEGDGNFVYLLTNMSGSRISLTGSVSVNGSITGSFSGSLANFTGTATHIPFFTSSQTLADSAMFQVDNGGGSYSIALNQNGVSGVAPEALFVYQLSSTSYNVISGKGNLNSYLQLNIQNENNGANASSDIVATANNGNESANYIDMGINGASFAGSIGTANDAYVYATGSNFHIGNINPSTYLGFFAGGSDVVVNNKLRLNPSNQHIMSGSLNISGSLIATGNATSITGSLFGTSSLALTASSADNFTVRNTLTATTLVVQTITSSVSYVTGSTRFGSIITNNHTFTGSLLVSGSFTSTGSLTTGTFLAISASTIRQEGTSSGTTGTLNILSSQSIYQGPYDASIYMGARITAVVNNGETAGYRLQVNNVGNTNAVLNFQKAYSVAVGQALPDSYTTLMQLTNTGMRVGSVITDNHLITGSVSISGSSLRLTGSLLVTGSASDQLLVGSNLLYVSSSGYVGIGTNTDFGDKLTITGSIRSIGGFLVGGGLNTGVLLSSGYNVTGAFASGLISLDGTWNTIGNPTAILLNITNTASGNASKLLDLQIGSVSKFAVDKNGSVTASRMTGNTIAPGIVAGTGAGTAPTISISGSDIAGIIRIATGTGPAAKNDVINVTFTSAYGAAPYVLVTPASFSSSLSFGGVSGTFATASTTGFTIFSGEGSLRGATAYSWSYHVFG